MTSPYDWADTPAEREYVDREFHRESDERSDRRREAHLEHTGPVAETDGPIMAAFHKAIGSPDCPNCGTRCASCDERMCVRYGPAPVFTDGGPLVCDRCTTESS